MDDALNRQQRQRSAAESIRAGRAILGDVRTLVRQPASANADEFCKLLNEAAGHLRSAAGQLNPGPDNELRADLQQLRFEVDILARTLSETDRMLGSWTHRLGVRTNGYTERGASAPLIVMKKVSITG